MIAFSGVPAAHATWWPGSPTCADPRRLQLLIQAPQLVVHPVHVRRERADLVPVRHLYVTREVTRRDRRQPPLRLPQRYESIGEEQTEIEESQEKAAGASADQEVARLAVRTPIGSDERVRAGVGLPGEDGECLRERSRPPVGTDEERMVGALRQSGGAGGREEERDRRRRATNGVALEHPVQRRSHGAEGERQGRLGSEGACPVLVESEALRGLRSRARVEAEPGELPADVLILSRSGRRCDRRGSLSQPRGRRKCDRSRLDPYGLHQRRLAAARIEPDEAVRPGREEAAQPR